ncbi:MAG: DUF2889 domain-containing protein [Clostridia bacterium]|nr:DUF2889 domain-containing protein [Clostridia bacterium]
MALFNRVKSCSVDELDQSLLEAKGIFIDTFHEINMTLHVNKDNLEIVWAKADMIRLPQAYCKEAQKQDRNLVGIKIGPGVSKAIQNAVGSDRGCTHLADLALDLVKSVIVTNTKLKLQGLSKEEIEEKLTDMFGGTCYHWTVLANRKQSAAGV